MRVTANCLSSATAKHQSNAFHEWTEIYNLGVLQPCIHPMCLSGLAWPSATPGTEQADDETAPVEKISIGYTNSTKKRRPRWFTLRICFKPVSYQPSHAACLRPGPHGVPWTPHLPVSALAFLAASSLLLLLLLPQSPLHSTASPHPLC
jgi:hypothetical protein